MVLKVLFDGKKWKTHFDGKLMWSKDWQSLEKRLGKKIKGKVTLEVSHPEIDRINKKHKYAPFELLGYNSYGDDDFYRSWDFGWSSAAFGFDSGFFLEEALREMVEYADRVKPKAEVMVLSLKMSKFIKREFFDVNFKDLNDETVKALKEIFWKGYHYGQDHQMEHLEALDNPNDYDWKKFDE